MSEPGLVTGSSNFLSMWPFLLLWALRNRLMLLILLVNLFLAFLGGLCCIFSSQRLCHLFDRISQGLTWSTTGFDLLSSRKLGCIPCEYGWQRTWGYLPCGPRSHIVNFQCFYVLFTPVSGLASWFSGLLLCHTLGDWILGALQAQKGQWSIFISQFIIWASGSGKLE